MNCDVRVAVHVVGILNSLLLLCTDKYFKVNFPKPCFSVLDGNEVNGTFKE